MKKQDQPTGSELIPVILGLMVVFYLALVFLGGVDYVASLMLVLYVLAGLVAVMVIWLGVATLGKSDIRKVFILYDRENARFVSKLYEALKTAPLRILWDKQEVQVGDNTEEKLKELFDSSSDIIFVVSHQSVAASWAEPAIAKAMRKNKRIFPALLDDAEPPEALQGIKAADFRHSFDDGYFSLREALKTRREETPRPPPPPTADAGQEAKPTIAPNPAPGGEDG